MPARQLANIRSADDLVEALRARAIERELPASGSMS